MIRRVEITGIHTDATTDLRKYIIRKIARLDKYMSKSSRQAAHIEVRLKESKSKENKKCTCEVVIHLPNETLNAHESTMNMFAAVDIVEEKLKTQLKKYKDLHYGSSSSHKDRRVRDFLGKIRSHRSAR